MSNSDWSMTKCAPGEPDDALFSSVDRVAILFRSDSGPLWPALTQTAQVLIKNGLHFSDWDARLYRVADHGCNRISPKIRRSLRSYIRANTARDVTGGNPVAI